MDFEFNSDQELIQKTFRDFVEQAVIPQAEAIDQRKEFPMELFKKVADLGFFGMRYPEDAGGVGADTISYCLATI
ncbi:MAG TPA: acyl-CoA dehydrogenase family protein, partial [Candidatus Poseidoniia archaeon]|nr:acyl-CoA dehydrogenase family protein [Candidatus Poseidoniia archaeon]